MGWSHNYRITLWNVLGKRKVPEEYPSGALTWLMVREDLQRK